MSTPVSTGSATERPDPARRLDEEATVAAGRIEHSHHRAGVTGPMVFATDLVDERLGRVPGTGTLAFLRRQDSS